MAAWQGDPSYGQGPGTRGYAPAGVPPRNPGPAELPEQAKWIRVAASICYFTALLAIAMVVFGTLTLLYFSDSGSFATTELSVLILLMAGMSLALLVPQLVVGFLLAKRPSMTLAITATALMGLSALMGLGQLMAGEVLGLIIGALTVLAGVVVAVLLWGRRDSRAFLLGAR